jgi:hypothetical protein
VHPGTGTRGEVVDPAGLQARSETNIDEVL